jgi:hypothetical protein
VAYVDALVVNTVQRGPSQMLGMEGGLAPMRRRPMQGMEGSTVIDALTGGEYGRVLAKLDHLEVVLQIAIIASCIAGAAGLVSLLWPRR